MATSPRANRGPSAAPENRAALIAAARSVFAARGLDAPLSSVAREAGVGQGSLYRHFPTRSSLAVAVFSENLDDLEALAARPGSTLGDLLRRITDQAVESTAFFEMLQVDHIDAGSLELTHRIRALLGPKAHAARAAGDVADWLTLDDLLLGVAMLAGALSKSAPAERAATAERIWMLLPFGPSPA
jgi:AcrR family transcriptional regulator